MDLKKMFKTVVDFFSFPDEEIPEEREEPQETEKKGKEKIYTYNDLSFTQDNYTGFIDAQMDFENGYHMHISIEDFTKDWLYQDHKKFLKRESPAGFSISIRDREGNWNKTCLNKNEKALVVYNKNAVTAIMKQVQQLDENGHLSAMHNAAMVEARKKHLLKMRERRKAHEKNHSEDAVSGLKVNDEIVANVTSGNEKRPITPVVALEYRKKLSRNQEN